MITTIVGANWGDEGKGKITDLLAESADIVIRYQGGANAGHTIINQYGRFALHCLPSGVFHKHIYNVIGNGVALDVTKFKKELDEISKTVSPKIMVSDRVQLLMSYHILFDTLEETRLQDASYGSTKSGIAPFYADKYAKIGFQVSECFLPLEKLKEKVHQVCTLKNVMLEHLYHHPKLDEAAILEELLEAKHILEPYLCDVTSFLKQAVSEGKHIILEGQLGALKDPDHGIYPMVTSSSTLSSFGPVGAGLFKDDKKKIVVVTKAYSSCVGAGEFVSELFDEAAHELRIHGGDQGEFGATTGRPRRVGWFDVVASRYGCDIQSATEVCLTLVDALGYLDEIPVCVAYEIDGKRVDSFPTTSTLQKAKPIYEVLPGWKEDVQGIREFDKLPQACQNYILFIEERLGHRISMVSNGPKREDIIYR